VEIIKAANGNQNLSRMVFSDLNIRHKPVGSTVRLLVPPPSG
jgi:hypothetical protein